MDQGFEIMGAEGHDHLGRFSIKERKGTPLRACERGSETRLVMNPAGLPDPGIPFAAMNANSLSNELIMRSRPSA